MAKQLNSHSKSRQPRAQASTSKKRKLANNDDSQQSPPKRSRYNLRSYGHAPQPESRLTSMPYDILVSEIFRHLLPLDILNLARTNKNLRSLLMNRKSEFIWAAARNNILPEMPIPPPFISSPEYARIAFHEEKCYHCEERPVRYPCQWYAHTYTCKNCRESEDIFCSLNKWGQMHPQQYSSLVRHFQIVDPENTLPRLPEKYRDGSRSHMYYIKEIRHWEKMGRKIRTREARLEWLRKAKQEWEERLEFMLAVKKWERLRVRYLEDEHEALVERRIDQVREYVNSLGWADVVARMPQDDEDVPFFQDIPWVDEFCREELTPKRLKTLNNHIHKHMLAIKQRLDRDEWRERTKSRISVLKEIRDAYAHEHSTSASPGPQLGLGLAELLLVPQIKEMVFADTETPMDREQLIAVFSSKYPRARHDMLQRVDAELLEALRAAYDNNPDITHDALKFATTIFKCVGHQQLFWHKQMTAHICPHNVIPYPYPDPATAYGLTTGLFFTQKDWIVAYFMGTTINKEAAIAAARVVSLCGLALTTSKDAMDELNPMIECMQCHDISSGRSVMSWMSAVHHMSVHGHDQIRRLNGRDEERARIAYTDKWERTSIQKGTLTVCAYCDHKFTPRQELVDHIKQSHGIPLVAISDQLHDERDPPTSVVGKLWPPWPE